MPVSALETAAHVVQLALTPVFLLSGIAALLNVFATRLGRVADQVDALTRDGAEAGSPGRDIQLRALHWRAQSLDWAVLLAAIGGVLTCGAVLVLFLGAVRGSGAASLLFTLFGGAIVFTMGSLAAFVTEMSLATRGVRRKIALDQRQDAAAGAEAAGGG